MPFAYLPTYRLLRLALLAVICLIFSGLAACKKETASSKLAKSLAACKFGIGVGFGDTADAVHGVLGAPVLTAEKQAGVLTEEYWIIKDPNAKPEDVPPPPAEFDPQLSLSFVEGKLAQLYNAYHVGDPSMPGPPFTIEALPGVKIGAKRSDLAAALGKPAMAGDKKDSWRFDGGDGTAYGIEVLYEHVDAASADLASAIRVSFFAHNANSKGEQFEKQKKINDSLHGR